MEPTTHCYSCDGNADIDRLPPRERVAVDEYWRAAHAFDSTLPGWLVLLPRRHITTIAELTDVEAASLGNWQVRLSRALHAVTGCSKTYVAQFSEAEGFTHVHFHIVPRPADLARETAARGCSASSAHVTCHRSAKPPWMSSRRSCPRTWRNRVDRRVLIPAACAPEPPLPGAE